MGGVRRGRLAWTFLLALSGFACTAAIADERPPSWHVYFGTDAAANSFFGYGGLIWSPRGTLYESGFRVLLAGHGGTYDYVSLNLEAPFECECGTEGCRKTITIDDFDRLAPLWDMALRRAFGNLGEVDQPLWSYVSEHEEVGAALGDPSRLPSIVRHRWLGAPRPRLARVR